MRFYNTIGARRWRTFVNRLCRRGHPMNQVRHAEYGSGGIEIVHEDPEDNFFVRQVRGGILWPTGASHGYVCIIGERSKFKAGKRPLVLLAEHTCQLPREMIRTICNETRRMMGRDYFCDFNENTYGFIEDLDVHVKKFRFGNVNPPNLMQCHVYHTIKKRMDIIWSILHLNNVD